MRVLVLLASTLFFVVSVPASAEWWEAETAHFIVKSRSSQEEAREYALEMEQFDAVLRTLQGMETGVEQASRANKPIIYRFGRPRDIARIANAPGSGIAGFFIPRAGNSVAFAPTRNSRDTSAKTSWQIREDPRARLDPRSVLLHEYAHYFMLQHFPGAYPRWYVEGFAETLATMKVEEDGNFHIGDPPQYRAAQIFQLQDFPLDEMLDDDHELTGLDALQHYATGWLLTHYMSFNPERLRQLRAYLVAIAAGEASLSAAKREFGDLGKLEQELESYKKGPFPGLRIANPNLDETVRTRRLSDAEEAAIMYEIRLARGGDEDEGASIAARLTSIAEEFPDDPHVLTILARAQLAAKNYVEADTVATRALALNPAIAVAWLVRAQASLEQAKGNPQLAERSRDHAIMAANSDPYDPRPQIQYYFSYSKLGETPPETAVIALEQVFDAAGGDTGYRLLLARQLLFEDRLDSARAVLLPVAYAGHRTGEPKDQDKPYLPRLLDLVREQDREGAIAMIDKIILEDEEEGDT